MAILLPALVFAASPVPRGNFSLVPTANCTAKLKLCYQGTNEAVTGIQKSDPLDSCARLHDAELIEGTCAEHGYGKLLLNPDPVFRKTSVWKPSEAPVVPNVPTQPYTGQTGKAWNNEFSSNCWTNVTLTGFSGKRALIITTSYGDKLPNGMPTGLCTEEAAEPYYVYLDSGMQVDMASILGGSIPHDDEPRSPGVKRFLKDKDAMAKMTNSLKIDNVNFTDYDVVFMAGGWGAAFDLGYSVVLGAQVGAALERGSPLIASVCHGALGFVQANMSDGTPWVKGKKVTGVTDAQIEKLGVSKYTPMHPETELRALGADYQCVHGNGLLGDIVAESVSVDMTMKAPLVTGQNQVGACITAQRQLLFLQWMHP